jgi:hypothetical protein
LLADWLDCGQEGHVVRVSAARRSPRPCEVCDDPIVQLVVDPSARRARAAKKHWLCLRCIDARGAQL